MTTPKSVLVFLLIIAAFTGFGFLYGEHPFRPPDGPEPVIAFGGVGVGVALSVLVGLVIIRSVRANRMPRFLGAVLLLFSSALNILAPVAIIRISAGVTMYRGIESGFHLFQGEHAQWVFVTFYGFWFVLSALAVLLVFLFTASRPKPPEASAGT